MRNDQPHNRGGMPLEVGPYTHLIGHSSSPTLDQTVALNNKFLYGSIIAAGSVAAMVVVRRWLNDQQRERERRAAERDLTGESPDREHHGKQQMPGSTVGMGALSSSCSSDTRTTPITVKRRQRAPSKSSEGGKKQHSDVHSLSKDPSATERGIEAFGQVTSKLRSFLPSISTSPQRDQRSIVETETAQSANIDEQAALDIAEPETPEAPSSEAADDAFDAPPGQSMSAAERKKAKKKQNRANRQRQTIASGSGHVDIPHSSPEASTSLASSSLTEGKGTNDARTKLGSKFSRKTQLVDSDGTDTESATPTATAHPTPRAKSKSKMDSVVHEQDPDSPTRSRTSSVASSTLSATDGHRERNDSAPSLSHTLSPRSDSNRLGSVSSTYPHTPAPTNIGLNLLNTDFESLKDQEHVTEWEQVGSAGKPKKKKKKRATEKSLDASGSSVSPPASSVSPLSNTSNTLPSVEAVSTQTTDATSASWISDHQPCPDCERRKQEDIERSEIGNNGHDINVAALEAIRKQLNQTEKDERTQRNLVESLTSTNTSLSERLDHMRVARDALQLTAQAAETRILELEQALAKQREDMARTISRPTSEEKRIAKQKGSEDWKKKHDALSKEYNEHKFRNARVSEEVSLGKLVFQLNAMLNFHLQLQNTISRQEAQIQELSQQFAPFQMLSQQLGPGVMPNANMQYFYMAPTMGLPSPSPMTPGFTAMNMPYAPPGYPAQPTGAPGHPSFESSPRRPLSQAPPRHRHERQPTNGPAIAAPHPYQQVSGMWSLNSSTASTSRPPSSPSRHSDVSASILKARNTSKDRASSRGSGPERLTGDTGLGLVSGELAQPENASAAESTRQADHPSSPPLGSDRKHPLVGDTTPSETRSAPPGRVKQSLSEPTTLPERLEIRIAQSTPTVGVCDSPSSGSVNVKDKEATNEDPQPATVAEEEYDEPVYASIRLPSPHTTSGLAAPTVEDSPAKEGVQAGERKIVEAADDDFAEPVYASIRDPVVEAAQPEDQSDAQVNNQHFGTQHSELGSAPEASTGHVIAEASLASSTVPNNQIGETVEPSQEDKPEADQEPSAKTEEAFPEPPATALAEDDYEEPVFASIRPR